MSIVEITKLGDMPVKFLEQILLVLRRGGFVKSKRGVNGGFYLARPPKDITVGEVVRFIEGSVEPISCVRKGYAGCGDLYKCAFRDIWQKVSKATSDIVDNVTFEDLVTKVDTAHNVPTYSI